MENRLIGAFLAVLGLNLKIILSQGWLFPALWQQIEQLTLIPTPSALTTGLVVFILRNQCLYDHQLKGSAYGFQLPLYLQNTIMIGKFGQDFIDLEEILNFLPRKKTSLIQSIIKWVVNQETTFLNHIYYPPHLLWKKMANHSPEVKNSHPPGSENKVLLEHSYSHLLINYFCLSLCYSSKDE